MKGNHVITLAKEELGKPPPCNGYRISHMGQKSSWSILIWSAHLTYHGLENRIVFDIVIW